MNPIKLSITALALLALAASPAAAECSNPQACEGQTAEVTRQHLGGRAVHRRGAKSQTTDERANFIGEDENGGRQKKKAKRNGKKRENKGRRRGHGRRKRGGTPPDQG